MSTTGSEEMTTVLSALTKILESQEKQSANRDEQLTSILATQKQLTEKIAHITASTPKKPTNASPAPRLHSNCSLREFSNWKTKFLDYSLLNNVHKLETKEQKAVFRALLDDEWLRILQFVLQTKLDDNSTSIDEVINEMQTYLRSQRNVVLDRKEFYSRNQQNGESFDDYYMILQEIAAFCDFCQQCIEDQYRDRIITGISDEETVRELLTEQKLTLNKAISICRARENANKDNEALQCSENTGAISKISTYRKEKNQSSRPSPKVYLCSFCNNEWHEKLANCPARGKQCNKCGEMNHFANSRKCRNANQSNYNRSASKASPPRPRKLYTLTVNDVTAKKHKQSRKSPKIKITAIYNGNKVQIPATPDTGAEISVIPTHEAVRLGADISKLNPPEDKLHAANNKELTCLGTFSAELQLGDKIVPVELYVVKEVQNFLLSWYHAIDLAILPLCFPQQINSIQQKSYKENRKPPDIPENYTPTPEEREKHLELIQASFPSVFDTSSTLKPMTGEAMNIPLKDDAVPFSLTTPRNIPYGWREKVKNKLQEMVKKGIIAEVTEPTEWCHEMVIQPKKDSDDIRICVDLTKLNQHVKRATYPSCTAYDVIQGIPRGTNYFTGLDAKTGYWQIKIAEEDQHLTTFITPYGRFKFLRAPMGLISSGDEYTRRGDHALSDVENTIKIVDDILIHDTDYKSHIGNIWSVLEKCEENKITLNPDKIKFAKEELEYCGFILNKEGFTSDEKKVEAISQFKTPTCITDLRSFMGLVCQLSDFSTDIAKTAEPLRQLLKKNHEWMWTSVHDQAFKDVKDALTSPPVLTYFNPKLPIMLQTDASRLNGLGFVLLQKHRDGWRLVKCGSRFLSETESRYATIEQEMLAVTWATKKCDIYLRGAQHYDVITDHRPLVPILNSKSLNEIENPRLQRLREKLIPYNFTTFWKKGKDHCIPDALSRAPIHKPNKDDEEAETEIENAIKEIISSAINCISTSSEDNQDQLIDMIIKASSEDDEYTTLRETILAGLPDQKCDWPLNIRGYFNMKSKLTVDNKIILCGHRIVIPQKLRKEMLNRLHTSHQGIERTKRRARQLIYWPNIDNDISNTRKSCIECQKYLPSNQKEPIAHDEIPARVFQQVSSDYFQYAGKYFLIYVDRLSGYPMVQVFDHEATAKKLITTLRHIFALTGAPEIFRCDNGPQYISKKFREFLQKWNVKIKPSTPHYPQSNGHAEVTVKAVKHLIAKCNESGNLDTDSFAMGLLELRNTPREDGRSPAQIVFGHPLRSNIPIHHTAFAKEHQKAMDECDQKKAVLQEKSDARYNKTAKPLSSFSIGNHVNIQDHRTGLWNKNGTIVGIGNNRDYLIKLNSGRVYRRNRRFLRTHHMLSPQNNAKVSTQNLQNHQSPVQITHQTPVQITHQTPVQIHHTPGQNRQNLTPDQNRKTPTLNRLPPMRNHQTPAQTPEQEQDAEEPDYTQRRSRRAVMRPKHLVIDPTAKVYKEEEYTEDDEDEDLPSSS